MKILLVQTSFLGDTILSTPVIAGIKKKHPDSELWMMTTPLSSSLVEKDPLLKGVIPFDKRKQYSGFTGLFKFAAILKSYKFDKVYSLHKSIRTSFLLLLSGIPDRICFDVARGSFFYTQKRTRLKKEHDVLRNLSILSDEVELSTLDTSMRLFPPDYDDLKADLHQILLECSDYVVLVPGSAWATKMWHEKGFKCVANHLVKKGLNVILTGSSEDHECCKRIAENNPSIINLAGKTTISEALYIQKQAKLVVCNDSMSLHMASAFGTPTVVIFCSTIPEFGYGPWKNEMSVIIEKKMGCRPCGSHGKTQCPTGTLNCMESIPDTEVIKAVDLLLKNLNENNQL